jgi:hypothetical protein
MSIVEYILVSAMAAYGLNMSSNIECFLSTLSPNTCPNILEVVLKSSIWTSWFLNIVTLMGSSIDACSRSKILRLKCWTVDSSTYKIGYTSKVDISLINLECNNWNVLANINIFLSFFWVSPMRCPCWSFLTSSFSSSFRSTYFE